MRVRNFFISATSITENGASESIPSTASTITDSSISNGDIVASFLTLSGNISTLDPYGSVNVYSKNGRSVLNGQITNIQFLKSEISAGTTDNADLIVVSAR